MADIDSDVTILTIAKLANVSHTTVSRSLNDSPLVKEATKIRIRKIANDLGYTPNLNAKGLVKQQSFTIGIFFTNMTHGTSSSFLTTVINQAKRTIPLEYSLTVNDIEEYLSGKNKIRKNQFDGIIVISQSKTDEKFIEDIYAKKIPIVVLNRKTQLHNIPNFSDNEYAAARRITEYAVTKGHTKFAVLQGLASFESSHSRTAGMLSVLRENNISTAIPIYQGDYSSTSGYTSMKELLSSEHKSTCVFAENDDMAIGAIRACNDFGLKVPNDISIFGYDDMDYSQYVIPAITTIHKATNKLISAGIDAITQLLRGSDPDGIKSFSDTPELIVRESVKTLEKE